MNFQQLLGEYECKIDAKGRMRMPSGLIAQLGQEEAPTFVINRGFEKCLMLYPEPVWERITNEINQLNLYNKKNRDFVRYFYRGAQKVAMDSADRILVSKRLLEYAGVDKEIILSAYNDRIEIWAADQYESLLEEEPEDFSDLAEDVLGRANGKTPEL
ncbi:division/cell wall cluster transcriptional repressor MraZ [Phaeodactylibacter luteus]|uniref:Transcriptional regulator MraZ n=1 Tax=Phaeodactylibacter luteus TaxID=1564516 RepID=A0A5C6RI06_9BACT|nr:division/cell wall cluster transcriptional repressor MraZ [Phaeodactylibacter luteus]TXB61535.1 division/cell wall cluster transcriptional repressor MraZ [Phaeodactylibacter luteus]